jgi:uncharacterized protein YndB with AHSA1/START domain
MCNYWVARLSEYVQLWGCTYHLPRGDAVTDSIEREITIQAGLATVWYLVSEPGWWVGEPVAEPVREPGAVTRRRTESMGEYPVRVEELRPQTYAAFRWASMFHGQDLTDENSTLVEFWLTEVDGGVRVRVLESGFESVEATPEQRAQGLADNTGGWPEELDRLRGLAEPARSR